MGNVEIDKVRFEQYIKDLMTMYSKTTPEKARLLYDFFSNEGVTIEQLEKGKQNLFRNKDTVWFPTANEIMKSLKDTTVEDILGFEVNL